MAQQFPDYRPAARGTAAPPGFQPDPQRQTQRNNGGPVGMGQPAKSLRTAIAPQGGRPTPPPPQAPTAGTGDPSALYPADQTANIERMLWSNRHSMDPMALVQQAFTGFLQRPASPDELQQLLSASSSVDDLTYRLLALKPTPPSPSPTQQAVLPPTGF